MGDVPEMIGRVEAAIMQALQGHGESEYAQRFGDKPHLAILDGTFDLAKVARAAIEAMREPTIAMRHACTFEEAEVTWPAMIDAALSADEGRKP